MAKTLKTIKIQVDDAEYRQYLEKEVELIKKRCNISPQAKIYFLCHYKWKEIFLIDGVIYVSHVTCELNRNNSTNISTMDFVELYKISLFKEYPKTLKDIAFEIKVLKDPRHTFTPDEFFDWIDMPSTINIDIDEPYYEVIKFLKTYTKETFETDRYYFYPKADGDLTYVLNLYAYDKKTNKEMKLYIPDKHENIDNEWVNTAPNLLGDIIVDDLGNSISGYQKRVCKKAFIELANKENTLLKTKNFWAMELVKQTIEPINILHEWSCHRCFCRPKLFGSIWVYDFPNENEEPSFMITDEFFTKVAIISFKNPKYLMQRIYKRQLAKAKLWELSKDEVYDLIKFLNEPSDSISLDYNKEVYDKYIKTNWQQLIFEYNHNTAGWGWGETGFSIPPEKDAERHSKVEALSFDLPIPDYMKLTSNTSCNDI